MAVLLIRALAVGHGQGMLARYPAQTLGLKRHLFNLSAVASLLLCAGVLVLWVRSYHYGGGGMSPRRPSPASTHLHSDRGVLRVRVCNRANAGSPPGAGMAVYRPLDNEYDLRADSTGDPHVFAAGLFTRPPASTTAGDRCTPRNTFRSGP